MKRRVFNLLTGTSLLAMMGAGRRAFAQSADVSLLKTTLTPSGAIRAGNAAGTIPAWTGGLTSVPAGIDWDPTKTLPPDFFASDAMLYEVNAGNMAQYADLLADNLKVFIQKSGFSLKVFPTHRTYAAPQFVYDNIAANVGRAQLDAGGGRLGFTGAFGGIPFPFLDSDPLKAGPQLIWNHETRWSGKYATYTDATYTVSDGQLIFVESANNSFKYPYYCVTSIDQYPGIIFRDWEHTDEPSNVAGGELVGAEPSNPSVLPNQIWQLLAGQGRVRKAPEIGYDTPSSYADGIINYDEYFGFGQQLDEYDWKFLGKKEMLIPYNNNKLINAHAAAAHGPKFINPDLMRWELHRVNVVEATLHPGKRNVLARRRFYLDEDTSMIGIAEAWDANGNPWRHEQVISINFPNLPGTFYGNSVAYNLQSGDYITITGPWADANANAPYNFAPITDNVFSPQAMAASASY